MLALSVGVAPLVACEVSKKSTREKETAGLSYENASVAEMIEEEASPDRTDELGELVAEHEGDLVGRLAIEVDEAHHEGTAHDD